MFVRVLVLVTKIPLMATARPVSRYGASSPATATDSLSRACWDHNGHWQIENFGA